MATMDKMDEVKQCVSATIQMIDHWKTAYEKLAKEYAQFRKEAADWGYVPQNPVPARSSSVVTKKTSSGPIFYFYHQEMNKNGAVKVAEFLSKLLKVKFVTISDASEIQHETDKLLYMATHLGGTSITNNFNSTKFNSFKKKLPISEHQIFVLAEGVKERGPYEPVTALFMDDGTPMSSILLSYHNGYNLEPIRINKEAVERLKRWIQR